MHLTHDKARTHWHCPLMGEACSGAECPMWRWTTKGPHAEIVRMVADEIGDKSPASKVAAAKVAAEPLRHGLHGYCGMAGTP